MKLAFLWTLMSIASLLLLPLRIMTANRAAERARQHVQVMQQITIKAREAVLKAAWLQAQADSVWLEPRLHQQKEECLVRISEQQPTSLLPPLYEATGIRFIDRIQEAHWWNIYYRNLGDNTLRAASRSRREVACLEMRRYFSPKIAADYLAYKHLR